MSQCRAASFPEKGRFRPLGGAHPSIAQLVERRTVDLTRVVILRSLVRFRLEGGAGRFCSPVKGTPSPAPLPRPTPCGSAASFLHGQRRESLWGSPAQPRVGRGLGTRLRRLLSAGRTQAPSPLFFAFALPPRPHSRPGPPNSWCAPKALQRGRQAPRPSQGQGQQGTLPESPSMPAQSPALPPKEALSAFSLPTSVSPSVFHMVSEVQTWGDRKPSQPSLGAELPPRDLSNLCQPCSYIEVDARRSKSQQGSQWA